MCLQGGVMQKITTVGFDADDTLWHNERFFRLSQDSFAELLVEFAEPDHLNERLLAAEKRNLARYGFGIKGFVLSMIETAIEVTDSQVPVATIGKLLDLGHEMLAHPIDLLPHAAGRIISGGRDRFGQDARSVSANLRTSRRRKRPGHDDRKFCQIRCDADAAGRRMGRARAA